MSPCPGHLSRVGAAGKLKGGFGSPVSRCRWTRDCSSPARWPARAWRSRSS